MDHSSDFAVREVSLGMESQVISGLRLDATAGRVFYTREYYDQFFEDYSRLISEALRTNNTVAFLSLGLAARYYDRNCFWAESYLKEAFKVSNLDTCMVALAAYKNYVTEDYRSFTGLEIQQLTSQNPNPDVARYFQQLIPIGSQMGTLCMREKKYIYVIPERYLKEFDETFAENQDTLFETQITTQPLGYSSSHPYYVKVGDGTLDLRSFESKFWSP